MVMLAFWTFSIFSCNSPEKETGITEAVVETTRRHHKDGYTFRSAAECRECHAEIVKEWELSPHAKTAHNPIYTKMAERFLLDRGGEFGSTTCTGCHMPGGIFLDEPALLDIEERAPISEEGVTCEVCHTATEFTPEDRGEFPSIRLLFDKSDTIFGANSLGQVGEHNIKKNDFTSSAGVCYGCHEIFVVHEESPALTEGQTCIDCHMTTAPGSPNEGEFSHQIIGLGYAYEDAVKNEPNQAQLLAKRQEWVARALKITDVYRLPQNGADRIAIDIENIFRAHWAPPVGGVNNMRQIWIEISVWDRNDTLIFESGKLDSQGDLFNEFSDDVQRGLADLDQQLWVFQPVYTNRVQDQSSPVLLFFDTNDIPQENVFRSEDLKNIQYSLPFPTQELYVEINLKQRNYSPYILREYDLDDYASTITSFTIDSWEGSL